MHDGMSSGPGAAIIINRVSAGRIQAKRYGTSAFYRVTTLIASNLNFISKDPHRVLGPGFGFCTWLNCYNKDTHSSPGS